MLLVHLLLLLLPPLPPGTPHHHSHMLIVSNTINIARSHMWNDVRACARACVYFYSGCTCSHAVIDVCVKKIVSPKIFIFFIFSVWHLCKLSLHYF